MRLRVFLLVICMCLVFSDLDGQKKAKKYSVSGFVTDISKNPVAGAMVLVDNNYTEVLTNKKGSFKIKVKPDAKLISVFTFDKGTGEALIDGEANLNITLNGVPSALPASLEKKVKGEEINIGYGSIEKKDLTTQVNKLDVKNSKFAAYSNIYELMKGTLPGVQVVGNRITIQGAASFLLSTDPLFIVDGMEVSTIDGISPTEVESIEVLKGSAASIYGSRGANGVIMIKLIGAPGSRK
jgi:TonB-dependent SusC/RagA subfamily outer membrane receptor